MYSLYWQKEAIQLNPLQEAWKSFHLGEKRYWRAPIAEYTDRKEHLKWISLCSVWKQAGTDSYVSWYSTGTRVPPSNENPEGVHLWKV